MMKRAFPRTDWQVLVFIILLLGIFPGIHEAKADTMPSGAILSPSVETGEASGRRDEEPGALTLVQEVGMARLFEGQAIVYPAARLSLEDSAGRRLGAHVEKGTRMRVLEDRDGRLLVMFEDSGRLVTGYVPRNVYVAKECTKDRYLGILSEKYESTGDPGKISSGRGDYGGKSYGAWQLSSRTGSLREFVSSLKETRPEFHARLSDAQRKDGGYRTRFDRSWKAIAEEHHDEFYQLQWTFTKEGYYEKAVRHAKRKGADIDALMEHVAVRNAVWSAAVQLGWGISGNYLAGLSGMTDPVEAIDTLYETRIRNIGSNFRSSPTLHSSLRNRFRNEWRDALEIHKLSTLHTASKAP